MTDHRTDAETRDTLRSDNYPVPPPHPDMMPGFDDGLVHDHGWACRERGAPAC